MHIFSFTGYKDTYIRFEYKLFKYRNNVCANKKHLMPKATICVTESATSCRMFYLNMLPIYMNSFMKTLNYIHKGFNDIRINARYYWTIRVHVDRNE